MESIQALAKPKQPAKSRGKGTTKAKVDPSQPQSVIDTVSYTGSGRMTKAPAVLSLPVTNLNSSAVGAAAARSRSQSTLPVTSETVEEKEVERDVSDDRVYCVCKTEYEEGKVMIACDRFAVLPAPRLCTVTLMVVDSQVRRMVPYAVFGHVRSGSRPCGSILLPSVHPE